MKSDSFMLRNTGQHIDLFLESQYYFLGLVCKNNLWSFDKITKCWIIIISWILFRISCDTFLKNLEYLFRTNLRTEISKSRETSLRITITILDFKCKLALSLFLYLISDQHNIIWSYFIIYLIYCCLIFEKSKLEIYELNNCEYYVIAWFRSYIEIIL